MQANGSRLAPGYWLVGPVFALVLGCDPEAVDPPVPSTPEAAYPLYLPSGCAGAPGSPVPIDEVELLFAGTAWDPDHLGWGTFRYLLVNDPASWENLRHRLDWGTDPRPDVDFERFVVVLVSDLSGTCGVSVDEVAVVAGADGQPHVEVAFIHPSEGGGDCRICLAYHLAHVAVAVPRPATGLPTACGRVVEGCP